KYMLFMARGYELLRAGGRLAFVVPNSWLGIKSGAAIRALLLKENALREITVFHSPVFEDPSVEVVTFLAEKEGPAKEISILPRRGAERRSVSIPALECLQVEDYSIPLHWDGAAADFFDLIRRDAIMLGAAESPFPPYIALQAYAEGLGTPPQ